MTKATRRFLVSGLIEFGPVTLFFVGASLYDFFVGTALLMIATALAVIFSLIRDRRLPLFSLLASSVVLLSGALTLLTREPRWVVLEYSLYNLLFGVAMGVGHLRGKPALKPLFNTMFLLTDRGWSVLSLRWGSFFIASGVASEAVWYLYGESVWVYFRFAMIAIGFIFGTSQFFLARRERLPESSPWGLHP